MKNMLYFLLIIFCTANVALIAMEDDEINFNSFSQDEMHNYSNMNPLFSDEQEWSIYKNQNKDVDSQDDKALQWQLVLYEKSEHFKNIVEEYKNQNKDNHEKYFLASWHDFCDWEKIENNQNITFENN